MTGLLALLAALVVGCGSPTSSDDEGDQGDGNGASALQAVYDKVKGLDPEQRREKLLQLAEKEGAGLSEEGTGKLNVYGSANLDEAEPIMSDFEDASGIEPSLYRASSTDLLQRILQENDANFGNGADVIYTNGPELQVLDEEGILLPLETPFTKNVPKEVIVSKNWVPIYLNAFVTAWNTERVTGDRIPKSWEDVLGNYSGELAMEVGDWDWFATLVTQYFEDRKGLSEEEALDVFRKAASGARTVDGHTLMTELLAAGEFEVASSVYKHRADQLKGDGAPVDWEPAVEPIVIRPNGIGIAADTNVPATALLFVDFMLTDVQQTLIEFDRTPADAKAPGGGIPKGVDVLISDLTELANERDKWEGLYEEVTRESGEAISD